MDISREKQELIFNAISKYMADTLIFYKNSPNDTIYWVDNPDMVGVRLFSFDKQTVFNLFEDYPHKLSRQQKEVFDNENPDWAEFFKDRK